MNLSDRDVNLRGYFPFNFCGDDLRREAQSLGKCLNYTTGESMLTSGSSAKHCGVILSGQAVAFKIDENGKRYQLCLEEGCFIGLETLHENSTYTAKITAATDVEVFFWNAEGLEKLTKESAEFKKALEFLNEGRTYQEKWLIPETDVSDPVLCSQRGHWLSVCSPAFVILPLVFLFLWALAMLIRRYPVTWLLVLGVCVAAGTLLYRQITDRANERLIVTTRNVIQIPGNEQSDLNVFRLYTLDSMTLCQNFFEQWFKCGSLILQTAEQTVQTPLLKEPLRTAALIQSFGERAALGRKIPISDGQEILLNSAVPESISGPNEEAVFAETASANESVPGNFQPMEFHAHWMLLLKMIGKPLLAFLVVLMLFPLMGQDLWMVLLLTALCVFGLMVYRYFTWRNHRYTIEEDCIRDRSGRPFLHKDQTLAMTYKIQSVRYAKKGFLQNLLNYGTVYVKAGEGELSFDFVGNPEQVQQKIKETCIKFEDKFFPLND